ncbi:Dbl homology domain-containing protein [Zychaea mexicana]|uniref:rho guanine nucleotide exchange factor n=1 Tax=Zychaea mexicana TaxID=64656 RepID=UPI0022FEB1E0|nr:rho guanine nucleotide exchange factor [Zychaea mexicana]KAI9480247.1 Dbl homology domain-containing protein [Zychaea mexicana]
MSPSTSTSTANNFYYPQQRASQPTTTYPDEGGRFSEDQFDIIDSLDYDDVDDGLIDHELVHRNREALVQQLYNSETAYLESLNLVANVFMQPLRKDAKQSSFAFLGMKKMVCTERETRWLFGNFDDIVQTQHLGPYADYFGCFSWLGKYLFLTTYERLTRYQPFKKFIDSAHKDSSLRGATLLSLLQIPAGCINRYAQLISKLADVTTPMHPDYMGLLTCKQRIIALAEEIKPKVDDADNVDQVLMIHQALIGAPFGVKAQRRLVLQGQLARVVVNSRSTGEERTYFLFSDLLAFVRPKQDGKRTLLQYKGHITLERARVRALTAEEAGAQDHCIEIVSSFQGVDTLNTTYMGAPTTHVLCTNSKEEQEEWLKQLEVVIHSLDRAATRAKNGNTFYIFDGLLFFFHIIKHVLTLPVCVYIYIYTFTSCTKSTHGP